MKLVINVNQDLNAVEGRTSVRRVLIVEVGREVEGGLLAEGSRERYRCLVEGPMTSHPSSRCPTFIPGMSPLRDSKSRPSDLSLAARASSRSLAMSAMRNFSSMMTEFSANC